MQDIEKNLKDSQESQALAPEMREAIQVLTVNKLLEPLVNDLNSNTEQMLSQESSPTSERSLDPLKQELVDQGLSPEDAEELLQIS